MSGFKFFALLFYFILTSLLYPQGTDSVKHMQDSILKLSEKKITKNSKEHTALFLSLKGGYHTINRDYDGLKSSWIAGLSLGAVVNRHWILGVAFDYSTSTILNYHLDGTQIIFDKKYKEYGVSLFCKYQFNFLKNKISIIAGTEIGTYKFKSSTSEGYFQSDSYLNVGFNAGFGFKILPFMSLDFEWSLYRLLIISENRRLLSVNNFKLGPTIYLYY